MRTFGDADAVMDLGYKDYLRIFLLLCDERTVTYRAMNIVEQDIRITRKSELLSGCMYCGTSNECKGEEPIWI